MLWEAHNNTIKVQLVVFVLGPSWYISTHTAPYLAPRGINDEPED